MVWLIFGMHGRALKGHFVYIVVAIRGAAFSAEAVAGESRPKDLALTDHAIAD
jgi:hypothetical protein